jgi:hypothetical protein
MEPERSLRCLQDITTGHSHGLVESSPHICILFLGFVLILFSHLRLTLKVAFFLQYEFVVFVVNKMQTAVSTVVTRCELVN